jgi:hypothetical protein
MNKINRRCFVRQAGLLTVASVALTAAASDIARADALQSQDSVSYQSTPSDGQHCSICKNYIAGAAGSATGTCKVVAGAVSPNGYCLAFESM